MCIDVANLTRIDASVLQSQFQRACRTCYVWSRDVVAIAGESPSNYLCEDWSTTLYCVLIALKDYCRSTTARYQTVTVLVERT